MWTKPHLLFGNLFTLFRLPLVESCCLNSFSLFFGFFIFMTRLFVMFGFFSTISFIFQFSDLFYSQIIFHFIFKIVLFVLKNDFTFICLPPICLHIIPLLILLFYFIYFRLLPYVSIIFFLFFVCERGYYHVPSHRIAPIID